MRGQMAASTCDTSATVARQVERQTKYAKKCRCCMPGRMAAKICDKSATVACQGELQPEYVMQKSQLHARLNGSLNMWKKYRSCMPGLMASEICDKSVTAACHIQFRPKYLKKCLMLGERAALICEKKCHSCMPGRMVAQNVKNMSQWHARANGSVNMWRRCHSVMVA
jgi:hypothetical protein